VGDRVGLDLKASVEGVAAPVLDTKDAEYVVDPQAAQPAPGFAEQLVGVTPGSPATFTLVMPEDYRNPAYAGKPAAFEVVVHWVKECQLPEVDDDFAQQVGDYADVSALRTTIETQLRAQEEQRVRERNEEAALSKLVEISSIEFPPQLVDHQAEHLKETFTRNIERQGFQLRQYLRLVGKEEGQLEQELRAEAESRIRRSLALDAFADAEHVDVDEDEVHDEVRRAAASTEQPEALQTLALNNPETLQRVQEITRERKALARLMELATGDGHTTRKNPAEATHTTDTQTHSAEPSAELAMTAADEDRGTE
jgi:trigger factor